MILDQIRAVLVASVICFQKIFGLHGLNHQIIEYWVSGGRYWLALGETGSEQGGTGCQHDELSKNIGLKVVIMRESLSIYVLYKNLLLKDFAVRSL